MAVVGPSGALISGSARARPTGVTTSGEGVAGSSYMHYTLTSGMAWGSPPFPMQSKDPDEAGGIVGQEPTGPAAVKLFKLA